MEPCGRPLIAIDARPLFFGQQTGVSRYLRNLLDALLRDDSGFDFLLYVHRPPGSPLPSSWRNVRLRVVGGLASAQKRLWENLTLPRALKKDGVNLFFGAAYVLPLRLPCPGVVTIHDISFEVHPEWFPPLRSRYVRLLSRTSARRAQAVITDSEFSRTEICRHYRIPLHQVRAIHLAADPCFSAAVTASEIERVRTDYQLPKLFLLYIGSLHQRRQIPEMIRAVSMLHQAHTLDHHLVLVGHNNFHPRTDIRALVHAADADGLVHVINYVPEKDLRALYAAADFVAYISRYEGFGLPVIEAMAAGRPVVTANTTSLAEIAGDAAILVDPTSTEAIAEAFRRLGQDAELRASLAERGRAHARRFSWAKTAADTLSVFRECLEPPRHPIS